MSTGSFEMIFCPGAFETFFSGTGVVAGDPYSTEPEYQRGADELREAWKGRTMFRRGKGYSFGLRLQSVHAAVVLAEYAEVCISSNMGGDREWSEVYAARKVLERIEAATGGRVSHDGWSVRLDGERVT